MITIGKKGETEREINPSLTTLHYILGMCVCVKVIIIRMKQKQYILHTKNVGKNFSLSLPLLISISLREPCVFEVSILHTDCRCQLNPCPDDAAQTDEKEPTPITLLLLLLASLLVHLTSGWSKRST